MKLNATFKQDIEIDPIEVIDSLLKRELGWGKLLFKKDQWIIETTQEVGPYLDVTTKNISIEKAEYIKALQLILSNLKKLNDS